jgi:pimeloyl-ACP methyl ester carboxylesterase
VLGEVGEDPLRRLAELVLDVDVVGAHGRQLTGAATALDNARVAGIEQWWREGDTVELELPGAARRIFVRRMGAGPVLTLLHGFPSSSHDWAKLAPELAQRHTLLMPDFLGFGASEKPADHAYSLHEQADLVQVLWRREGVDATAIAAHDYATSVTQELLARASDGPGGPAALDGVQIGSVTLLNGGVYPDLHRPLPAQTALLDPEHGPKLGPLMSEQTLALGLAPTFAGGYDATRDVADMWRAISRGDGHLISHLLIRYIVDRERHGERWVRAMESTAVPLAFVWGMQDPISGAHIAQRLAQRLPRARLVELDDVGHWPPLEAPERVAAELLAATR